MQFCERKKKITKKKVSPLKSTTTKDEFKKPRIFLNHLKLYDPEMSDPNVLKFKSLFHENFDSEISSNL